MQRRQFVSLAAATVVTSLGACTTNGSSSDNAAKRREIDAGVDGAIAKLYSSANGSRELVRKAQGVLIFPRVIAAGLVVGGEYGDGALRIAGSTSGYYSTASGSFGLQAGGQSKAVYFLFMNNDVLQKFTMSKGWTAGVDGSVALAKIGANGDLDLDTIKAPVIGFVLTNAGLMANLTVEGTKVTKLDI